MELFHITQIKLTKAALIALIIGYINLTLLQFLNEGINQL